MSKIQILRSLVNERLTAAAEEIFGVFERTIEEYEGEIDRQRELLDALKAEMIETLRGDLPQLSVCEEEVPPEQQERSPSLGQEEPEPLHIKEEQEELWTSLEGEQLQGLEEADIIKMTSTPVPVKSEHDEEKPQSSWFNQTQTEENREAEPLASTSTEQMKTEPDGEDCGVSEPDSNLDPAGDLQPTRDGQLLSSDCSGTETDDSDDWEETGEPQSGVKKLKSRKTQKVKVKRSSISNKFKRSTESSLELESSNKISFTNFCYVCGITCSNKSSFTRHVKVHLRGCGLCGKQLGPTESVSLHLQAHRTCRFCGKVCPDYTKLERHVRVHTGEKVVGCSVCGKRFADGSTLRKHVRIYTGEKPFSCSVCCQKFGRKASLMRHMIIHTGEKLFGCTICDRRFGQKEHMQRHMVTHATGSFSHAI